MPSPTSLGAEIAHSAAFRLTIRFAAVFVACLLVADLAIGFGARWIVRERTIAALDETLGRGPRSARPRPYPEDVPASVASGPVAADASDRPDPA